jgi:hypothetical protein
MPLRFCAEQCCSAQFELVEMIDGRFRFELTEGCRSIAEAHQDDRTQAAFAVIRSKSLSPIMRARDGWPPASAMVSVR